MSKVKRYDLVGDYDPIIDAMGDGDYVRYEDYVKQAMALELATTTLRIIAVNPAKYLVPEYLAAEILRQIDEVMK